MFVDKILACLIRLVSGCYFYINDNIMDDDDDVKIPWVCPNAMLLSLNAIGGQSHGTGPKQLCALACLGYTRIVGTF